MIVVVDYGMGNVGSVLNMGRKAGGEFCISHDAEQVAAADKLVLPGVGAFDQGMANLERGGLLDALNYAVKIRRVPILGICLGVQLFTRGSEEGCQPGLSWIAADTIRFRFPESRTDLKVPHMGWNRVSSAKDDLLIANLQHETRFYFVHSYHLHCDDPIDVLLWAEHGYRFVAGIQHENIWGVQFHPEKSHRFGLALIRNFIALPG